MKSQVKKKENQIENTDLWDMCCPGYGDLYSDSNEDCVVLR